MTGAIAAVLVGIVLMAGLLPLASAQMETMMGNTMSETLTLPSNEYKAYGVSLSPASPFTFSVRVTAGGPVDVYLFNATSYAEYKDPMELTFGYYSAGTQENTMSFSGRFTASRAATYYLVVDNAPISASGAMGGASATVAVSAQVGSPAGDPALLLVSVVVIAVLGVGSVLIVLSVRRKRRKAAVLPPTVPAWPAPPGGVPPPQLPASPPSYPPSQLPPPPGPPGP